MPKRFSSRAAPIERPLPLWILYPLFFAGIYSAHYPLLRLPWFWDEAGYYIPAALDFLHTGSLIPHSTITNAHPPLPSILLAGWWHLAGSSIPGTRAFLCMVAAAAMLAIFRLSRILCGTSVAVAVTALTALYPVWFAQSTLAHADLFAATFTLWALSYYFEGRSAIPIAVLFSFAALSKETAIVTPFALALWEIVRHLRQHTSKSWQTPVALLFPVLPLSLWYAFHHHVTGFTFGNPEFLRYNATANLSPARIALSLWHRIVHLTFHMNLFVPVAAALALLPMTRRMRSTLNRQTFSAIAVIVAANALAFSILGGALLTRYLLPLYPLILLVCVAFWRERLKAWPALVVLSAVAFLFALFINPPYSFAPEDNLTYRDFIVLHQRAIHLIAARYPNAQVLTAWPATAELTYPDLGYTAKPIASVAIDNFAADQVEKAAADPGLFDTALVFSTKWVPPQNALSFNRHTEETDTRFFDFHRDLSPAEVAALLHGEIVWQARSHGEWAAVLRFPRSSEAALHPPAQRLQ